MNAHASIPAEPPESDDAWARAVLQRQCDMLGRLAEIGLQMAEGVGREAASGGADPNVLAMAYARVSRAVRLSLMLQSRLIRDFRTPPKAPSAEAKADKVKDVNDYEIYWANGQPLSLAAEKRVLRQSVRGLAEDRGLDAETVERLEAEALEQLQREDLYPTAPGPRCRPFHDIVGLICEDLGLGPHLPPRAPSFAAENGGEGELCDRQGRSCERPPDGRAGLADPGVKPGEERVGVGEGGIHPRFDSSS